MDVLVSYDAPPKIGGAHMWMYEVYRRWPSPVRLLTARYDDDPGEAARERAFDAQTHGSLSIHRIAWMQQIALLDPRSWAASLSQAAQIRRLGERGGTRVHAIRAFPEGFAALLFRLTRPRSSRLITYAHGEELLVARSSRLLTQMATHVFAHSDLVIVNSDNTRGLVRDFLPAANFICIHPGVDAAAFASRENAIRDYRVALGWPSGTVIVSTVARMEPRKNQAAVLRAIAHLRSSGVPLAYICAGDGEERVALEELARSLSLEPWVRFPGRVTDGEKRLIFSASDIHAMPSTQVGTMIEGFGIVFIEAAAAGIPSIAGKVGGQAEAVLHGETGLVVDGSDFEQLCAALMTLATDPGMRRRMGEAAREWATANDWDTIMRRTHAAVEALP
jgi:phosphatidylinositol alpha-1,6-mannosyltransferase